MEAAATPSSSKVIIQCTDPSNLIDTFRERVEPRTPLKNLHWKSPSRPLRSIPSLNISLVRHESSQNGVQSNVRRHQIPGLRETPYVKLYLLHCDDKETYKETARKEIKQWIRENTFEKESKSVLKNQEYHDAFEWMIVHVVYPGTQASNQPQSSKHISLQDTESTDSVNSKSKWTGKSSSTIYDKLRADFSSSKLAVPRVAQVRILDPAKPPGALGPAEIEEQWRDFIDNLKASILKSFDTRVAQYEEDIKEREAQRTLPGWNFCTFFVLKEGLARGFESVGLLEDALAVYAELEIGLDTVIKDTHARDEVESSGTLLPYSNSLKTTIRHALDQEDEEEHNIDGALTTIKLAQILAYNDSTLPFDAETRKYRELILANDVSPLDVRTYIFTRQLEVLLRRARIVSTSNKLDYVVMADLAELALNFINLGSRELRMDLLTAWGGRLSGEERATQKVVIGNVVASWTWTAVMQILSYLLPHADLELRSFDESNDVLGDDAQLTHTKVDEVKVDSSRASSDHLGFQTESLHSNAKRRSDGPRTVTGLKKPGADRLCSTIAKLFLMARKTVENLPAVTPWLEEIRQVDVSGSGAKLHRLASGFGLSTMNGNDDAHFPDAVVKYRLRALAPNVLKQATSSREAFHQVYCVLSKVMHHLFVRSASRHSARQVLIDLAMLAFSEGDRSFARQCISTILGADSGELMVAAQPHVLAMYAECLRQEDRPNDLVLCLIAILRTSSSNGIGESMQKQRDELIELAQKTSGLESPLDTIAELLSVGRTITPTGRAGSFTLPLTLRSRFATALPLGKASLRLKALSQQEPPSIILSGPPVCELGEQPSTILFTANVSVNGWYQIDELEMQLGNVRFLHHFANAESRSVSNYTPPLSSSDAQPLLLYRSGSSPQISASQSKVLDLEKTQSLTLTMATAEQYFDACTLLARPGTGGLRLNLLDAIISSNEGDVAMSIERDPRGTILKLSGLGHNARVDIDVPYSLESSAESSVSLKCLLEYRHDGEIYSVYQSCSADTELPLSVSVQDIYRTGHWYSTFMLSTAIASPIELIGCQLDEVDRITVSEPDMANYPITIFSQQPAQWLVRLQQDDSSPSGVPLKLKVLYRRIDEWALESLRRSFLASATGAGFSAAANDLSDHLVSTTRQKWSEQDLELIGLTFEIQKWAKSEMNWQQVLAAFDQSARNSMDEWLTKWHAESQWVVLDSEAAAERVRELRLKVDVRTPPPVIIAALNVHMPEGQMTAVLGQPLMCTLAIQAPPFSDESVQVAYELLASADAWLVGGRKKGTVCTGVEECQSIALFPQRSGRLLLPIVNIRCRKIGATAFQPGDEGIDVPVEVHNKTISQSIQVTPHLRSTTLGLTSVEATAGAGTGAATGVGWVVLQSQGRG